LLRYLVDDLNSQRGFHDDPLRDVLKASDSLRDVFYAFDALGIL